MNNFSSLSDQLGHNDDIENQGVAPTGDQQWKLPYLARDYDRHGSERWYVRVRGKPKIRIYDEPGTDAFRTAYWKARKGEPGRTERRRKRNIYEVATENAAEYAFSGAKKRAPRRSIAFALDWDEAQRILRAQRHVCAVSGLKFRFSHGRQGLVGIRNAFAPSLDRMDCAKGYQPGNVRWVLQAVNIALADWGDDQLVEIARAIVAKHPAA